MRGKRWLWVALIVGVGILVSKHWLLDTAAAPGEPYVIDIDALHRTATAAGPLPQSIEVEKVGDFAFPETMVVAGSGFGMHRMVLLAHRILWPDRSLVIDTAMSPEAAKSLPGAKMDAAAFERVQSAMRAANAIVFTHEHPDHVGGLASAHDFASMAGKVQITAGQLNGPKLDRSAFAPGTLESLRPFDYQGLYAVAPGVVLQKAPGHSAGSQLVYVELASGARFLFVGDVAWSSDNIGRQVGRPRLTGLLLDEDRPAVAAQLRALALLPSNVHVVVAHDPLALERDIEAGLYRRGFGGQP